LYQSLGDRSRGASLEQLRPALREWLARKVEPDLAKMTYVEELTKVSTRVETFLLAPRVDVVHAADDPAIGPATAAVEVVMFGDFQSQAYARYALTMPRVRDLFGGRVRVVFKHFPANDPASIAAAEAAACANLQARFWPFHDTLLGEAGALDAARFKQVATAVGIDRTTFDPCVDREDTRDRIGAALEETRRYDLPGSPSILVNGRLAPEPPPFLPAFEFFKRIVEEELQRQAKDAASPR
jgi:protein-disulfide isomerase